MKILKGNGSDHEPELSDYWRQKFHHGYIGQLQRSIAEDKVNVFGYTGNKNRSSFDRILAWSLMDNFEWARGYAERFGLFWTNFTDPGRATYRKKSADFYANVVTTNKIPPS